jgi:glucokinase
MSTLITFDDRLGSRTRRHMNLLVADIGGTQLIFELGLIQEAIPTD